MKPATTLKSRTTVTAEKQMQEYHMRMLEVAIQRGADFPEAMTFANACVEEQRKLVTKAEARQKAARLANRKPARPKDSGADTGKVVGIRPIT